MNLILNETKWVIVVIHPNRSKARDDDAADRAKVHTSNSGTYLSFMVFI